MAPKVVDHEQRREEIAAAVLRVIARTGVAGVSVRSVAAEADWSTGAIRHYFPSQNDMLAAGAVAAIEQVTGRVRARPAPTGPLSVEDAASWVEEVLPLDAQRRAEAEVWLAIVGAAHSDTALRAIVLEAHQGLRLLCHDVLELLLGADQQERLDAEADTLHGLVDGLAVHLTVAQDELSAQRARTAVRTHLRRVIAAP